MPCQDCGDLVENPPTWVISASMLNILWGDVLPRLLASRWLNEVNGAPPPGSDLKPGCTISELHAMTSALGGSNEFIARQDALLTYLASADCRVPIYFHETLDGGFDFLLSEHGIEFFIPERPDDQQDLVRFYTYRRTGRRPIGTPGYLAGGVATDAPTGPSQLLVDEANLLAILSGAGQGGDVVEGEKEGEEDRVEPPDCAEEVMRCLEHFPRAADDGRAPEHVRDSRSLTAAAYQGLMESARCWQVEGTVYRGIMVDLPRVVAVCWLEQLSCADPAGSAYHKMFVDPGEGGLREIFRERLETSLPIASNMKFEVHPADTPACQARWVNDDVMITSHGFYVPRLPATPPERDIYKAITDGDAGNPVFTDSMASI